MYVTSYTYWLAAILNTEYILRQLFFFFFLSSDLFHDMYKVC